MNKSKSVSENISESYKIFLEQTEKETVQIIKCEPHIVVIIDELESDWKHKVNLQDTRYLLVFDITDLTRESTGTHERAILCSWNISLSGEKTYHFRYLEDNRFGPQLFKSGMDMDIHTLITQIVCCTNDGILLKKDKITEMKQILSVKVYQMDKDGRIVYQADVK